MSIELALPGHPPAPCVRYQLHVHAELTRDRRAADPRVPGRSRHEDALVSREPDALSPWLFYCCAAGVRVDEVRVVLRHDPPPDGPPAEAAGEAPDHAPTDLSPEPSGARPAPGGAVADDPKEAPQPTAPPGAERMVFTLHDVYVVSVLSSMEDGRPLETVALSYGRITWSAPDAQTTTWDVYAARQEAP